MIFSRWSVIGGDFGHVGVWFLRSRLKDPVLPIKHCTLQSPGGHFCDVENSEAFVFGQNSTL